MPCPNLFPTTTLPQRVAFIGEAPGHDEESVGQPFVGASGRLLTALAARAGLPRCACFFGNVSQHRPLGNDFSAFEWNGLQVQHGLDQLRQDLDRWRPNIVVLLGNVPLKAAKDPATVHPLLPRYFRYKNSQWRGSLFTADALSPFAGMKCLASYHPAYCLRDYECKPLLQFDLRKAARESLTPELRLPQRNLIVNNDPRFLITALEAIQYRKQPVAIDIEGVVDHMTCISFATSPDYAFIVPFVRKDGTPALPPDAAPFVWRALARVLEDPSVPKVLQNSLYDRFVLHYSYGIRVRGVVDDTMLKHWELYSELEKSLALQASLYTDEPYYKGDRKTQDDHTFFQYCCRDSAVTLEINQKLEPMLYPTSRNHYHTNIDLLNPLLYMELRGIRYDSEGAARRRTELRRRLFETQARFNALTGRGFRWRTLSEVFQRARDLMGLKRASILSFDSLAFQSTKAYQAEALQLRYLVKSPAPNLATCGEIEDLCEVSLNVDSTKQFIPFLYEELGLPTQYTQERNKEPRPTADYEALLKLARECTKRDDERLPIIHTAIEIRALGTRQQMLGISADRDGRIRCGYNIVGSNTGRITCYESPTGSGYNLQTIPNYTNPKEAPGGVLGDRDLFLADDGYWFFQCDLSGADGWTVAAYSAMLGDDSMLQDYYAGVRPFEVLCLMLRGLPVPKDRKELRAICKQHIGKDDWDRFACKRVQHGGSYLEGDLTISRNILKDSEGKLYMTPTECGKLKTFFFQRYWGVRRWQDWVGTKIRERPFLTAASGQVRQFFGRPEDALTKAVAFEPQANTTWATNLALHKLWNDPENRRTRFVIEAESDVPGTASSDVKLRIEPLHQVHDALCGQFRKDETEWAVPQIRSYFNNALEIAGQRIVIPFDGAYGPSWGVMPKENKI